MADPTDAAALTPADGALALIEDRSADPWTARARPTFLYVMYALLLWAIPVGVIAAVRPDVADAMAIATAAYLHAIPEPLYALFATGYLGYTVARQWGRCEGWTGEVEVKSRTSVNFLNFGGAWVVCRVARVARGQPSRES